MSLSSDSRFGEQGHTVVAGKFTHGADTPAPPDRSFAPAAQRMLSPGQPCAAASTETGPAKGASRRYIPQFALSAASYFRRSRPPQGPAGAAAADTLPAPRQLDRNVSPTLDEQATKAEEIYRNAEAALLRCEPLQMQWEQDVHDHSSRYAEFERSSARWFLLPHEAAAAVRAGEDLSWRSYHQLP